MVNNEDDGRTPEDAETISSSCASNVSGELKTGPLKMVYQIYNCF